MLEILKTEFSVERSANVGKKLDFEEKVEEEKHDLAMKINVNLNLSYNF